MNKRWTLYILECKDGSLYTGITNDVTRRIHSHRTGKAARYTRGRGPIRLVYKERCRDKSSALKREYAVKRLKRREKLVMISRQDMEIE
jgi:putative endonuclease